MLYSTYLSDYVYCHYYSTRNFYWICMQRYLKECYMNLQACNQYQTIWRKSRSPNKEKAIEERNTNINALANTGNQINRVKMATSLTKQMLEIVSEVLVRLLVQLSNSYEALTHFSHSILELSICHCKPVTLLRLNFAVKFE